MSDVVPEATIERIDSTGGEPVDERRRRLLLAGAAGLLALAGVAVPLIVVLVSRTSSASFADTEVLPDNRLGAATLDIEIEATPGGPGGSAGDQAPSEAVGGAEALFSATNLAPGDAVTGQLEMTNRGDLTFRYSLIAVADGGLLGQWLRFEVWPGTGSCAPGQPGVRVIEDVQVGTKPVPLVELVRTDGVNVLAPGESSLWCIGATLPLDTPNEAQGQRLDLTLVVAAEQAAEIGR